MAASKIDQPTLWKSDQDDNAKLKRELDSCEKENRSLNNLVAHIAEAVIRHVKDKK
jgi:translation initiation factor IF-2